MTAIDPNIELLVVVHHLTSASADVQKMLAVLIDAAGENGIISLLPTNAATIKHLLSVQSKLIANLMEQNQEVFDRIEKLVTRLNPQ